MHDVAPMLPLSVRMSHLDYPGVVAVFGDAFRLVVDTDAASYRLQRFGLSSGGPVWVPAGGGRALSSLPKLVARFGGQVPGLEAVAASLPADPAAALPEFAARVAVQRQFLALSRADKARALRARSAAFFAQGAEKLASEGRSTVSWGGAPRQIGEKGPLGPSRRGRSPAGR